MKILQLCKKFPFPLKDGESIAITNLSKALNELGCDVSLLSMNTKKHYFDLSKLPSDFNHYSSIHEVKLDNELKVKDAFLNLFSKESYHISRFVSTDFEMSLKRILQKKKFDIIQLETLYLAPYIPIIRKYSDAIISMRAHNVEHEIWERIAGNTGFLPKKWYLKHLTKKLKKYEVKHLNEYDLLIPITNRDLGKFRKLGYKNGVAVTPIGIDQEDYIPDFSSFSKELSISFIGSLDWMPNQEGLQWFLENVWPKAIRRFPDLSLHVAGRNTPNRLLNTNIKNVKFHGEVPCAPTFINEHPIMVVPLLSGSGMRAKILEGMALGRVVLTTKIGLEGIGATSKKEVLVADKVDEFLETIEYCYKKKENLYRIGHNAIEFVNQNYNNLQVANKLAVSYKTLIAKQESHLFKAVHK
jgi:glycosyltransferase involved in cell wall biosynthesis